MINKQNYLPGNFKPIHNLMRLFFQDTQKEIYFYIEGYKLARPLTSGKAAIVEDNKAKISRGKQKAGTVTTIVVIFSVKIYRV